MSENEQELTELALRRVYRKRRFAKVWRAWNRFVVWVNKSWPEK